MVRHGLCRRHWGVGEGFISISLFPTCAINPFRLIIFLSKFGTVRNSNGVMSLRYPQCILATLNTSIQNGRMKDEQQVLQSTTTHPSASFLQLFNDTSTLPSIHYSLTQIESHKSRFHFISPRLYVQCLCNSRCVLFCSSAVSRPQAWKVKKYHYFSRRFLTLS